MTSPPRSFSPGERGGRKTKQKKPLPPGGGVGER